MKLIELMQPWINKELIDCEIYGIHNDSREIRPGFLFFAYPGAIADGRKFIDKAVNSGAVAIVYDPDNWPVNCHLPAQITCIALPGLAYKQAAIASRFYGEPTKKLAVTGITGTNGKTTIAYQLAQAYLLLAQPAIYIGTLGQGNVNALQPLTNTTPDAFSLQRLFYQYQQQGVKQVCMEVSSHALTQLRVDNIDFNQAIFTNLTHDHLDYHHTMAAYAAAKALLFAKPSLEYALINQDDSYHKIMEAAVNSATKIIRYGITENSDVRAINWQISLQGTQVQVKSLWGEQQLSLNALGFFNIYNALAVFTSLMTADYDIKQVIAVMAKLQAAPGRMEVIAQKPYIIVDYAHTPDALANVLTTLKHVKTGQIVVVFGCGGDRDKDKRPMMGKIVSQYADIVMITSDNPRHENPKIILDEIEAGIIAGSTVYKIEDREKAIAKAINLANQNDIILVAGKGHETYQQIGDIRYPFSDQEIIRKLTNQ